MGNSDSVAMKKMSLHLSSAKASSLLLIGICFLLSCQNTSVNSQTTRADLVSQKETKMEKTFKSLKDFKWKNRIILTKETEKKTLSQLKDNKTEINERDIIWFHLEDDKIETNYDGDLPEDFAKHLEKDYFEKYDLHTLLIGKDGTVKSKDKELNLKNYFGQIDSMPMRRQEMKRN